MSYRRRGQRDVLGFVQSSGPDTRTETKVIQVVVDRLQESFPEASPYTMKKHAVDGRNHTAWPCAAAWPSLRRMCRGLDLVFAENGGIEAGDFP